MLDRSHPTFARKPGRITVKISSKTPRRRSICAAGALFTFFTKSASVTLSRSSTPLMRCPARSRPAASDSSPPGGRSLRRTLSRLPAQGSFRQPQDLAQRVFSRLPAQPVAAALCPEYRPRCGSSSARAGFSPCISGDFCRAASFMDGSPPTDAPPDPPAPAGHSGHGSKSSASIREQRRGYIPVAGVRQEDDDGLARFPALGQLGWPPMPPRAEEMPTSTPSALPICLPTCKGVSLATRMISS